MRPGPTVTVIGDGAVGLSAVLAAAQLGAERIILMGRHRDRTDLGVEFGATDVVPERGHEGIAALLELTGGEGSHVVLEAVGLMPAYEQAYGVVRPGGVISRVGVPQYEDAPIGFGSLFGKNITLTGGPAPVRAYLTQAIPEVLAGRINPGRVFDVTLPLEPDPRRLPGDGPPGGAEGADQALGAPAGAGRACRWVTVAADQANRPTEGYEMATRTDFTEEEWKTLKVGLLGAGMTVSVSDGGLISAFKEAAGVGRAIQAEVARGGLVGEIANMTVGRPSKDDMGGRNVGTAVLVALQSARAILEAKAPEELTAYQLAVVAVAQAAAEASKGVQPAEAATIEAIKAAVGLSGRCSPGPGGGRCGSRGGVGGGVGAPGRRSPLVLALGPDVEGRPPLLDDEQVVARPHQIRQLLEAVHSRVEIRLQLVQVAAELAEVRPARVVAGLFEGGEQEPLVQPRPGRLCGARLGRLGLLVGGEQFGEDEPVTGLAEGLGGLLLAEAVDRPAPPRAAASQGR